MGTSLARIPDSFYQHKGKGQSPREWYPKARAPICKLTAKAIEELRNLCKQRNFWVLELRRRYGYKYGEYIWEFQDEPINKDNRLFQVPHLLTILSLPPDIEKEIRGKVLCFKFFFKLTFFWPVLFIREGSIERDKMMKMKRAEKE